MSRMFLPCLAAAFLFMTWTDTHTDEVPVILGFLLILSVALGSLFPKQFLVTWIVLGAAVPVAETLVHFSILQAPYAPSTGFPWPALVAFIPTVVGVGIGAGARNFTRHQPN